MSTDDTPQKDWLAKQLEESSFRKRFEQELLSHQFCEQFEVALEETKVSRSQLAARLGRSRAFVSQALRRGRNLTIKTMAELADALGYRINLHFERRDAESPLIAFTVNCSNREGWYWFRESGRQQNDPLVQPAWFGASVTNTMDSPEAVAVEDHRQRIAEHEDTAGLRLGDLVH